MDLNFTTLIFETINFVVLVWILWRVLYRPLRQSVEARRAALAAELERAQRARQESDDREKEWAARETELATLRETTRRDALDAAEAEKSRLLASAREDASAELTRVRQLLETEREAAGRWVHNAVFERATELAGRLLIALAPGETDRVLADRLVEEVERADAFEGAPTDAGPLEVEIAGVQLPEALLVDRIKGALAGSTTRPLKLTTRQDPTLVAGWTLRVGDRLFDASIAGQLEAFRDLARSLDPAAEGPRP